MRVAFFTRYTSLALTTCRLESFIRHAFTSKTKGIFYRILMSERITASHWRARITEINAKARELRALDAKAKIVVFIDELNTAMILGNVKEVLCDRRLDGEPLESNIFFVGAVNPRRIDAVRTSAYNATGVRNNIVEADFVVQTMSDSLRLLVLDFGTMRPDQERLFLHSLLQDPSISVNKFLSTSPLDKEEPHADDLKMKYLGNLMEMILFSQNFLRTCRREGKIESRVHVSIRDIIRAVKLYTFFSEHSKQDGLHALVFDEENLVAGDVSSRRHWVSLCLAIAITYYFRLPERFTAVVGEQEFETRQAFLNDIRAKLATWRVPHHVCFTTILQKRIDTFFAQTKLPDGIAPTRTLRENIYCMAVCIEACIPLIVTGPPGCSKTLSFNMTAENMRGVGSSGLIFRHLKKLSRFNYQCSEQSTAAEIEAVARDTESRQENLIRHRQYGEMSTLFLDEAGLPHERKQAMKIMHYYLDHPKVAYVILSNNTLDAAKTNRCVQLMQINSSMEDLKALATGCLCPRDGNKPKAALRQTIEGLCIAFLKCNEEGILADIPLQAQGDNKEKHLFHIRDLVYLLRFLKRAASERGADYADLEITEDMLLAGLRRNFNGLSSRGFTRLVQLFFKEIQAAGRQSFKIPDEVGCRPNTLETLREALRDRVKKGDNPSHSAFRHIMIIDPTNCSAAVDVLMAENLLGDDGRRLVRCNVSDFADDANDREHSLRISELKSAMLRGDRVVMVNSSAIHSSFFGQFCFVTMPRGFACNS
jgi:E3 ubiquitin-protein ligase RNF213